MAQTCRLFCAKRLAIAVPHAPAPITVIFFVMSKICFLNGQFIDRSKASINIEDRAFQFADSVYEVILFKNGKLIDIVPHLDRLFDGLLQLNIKHHFLQDEIIANILELFRRNKMDEGFLYLQVSRGVAKRAQGLPQNIEPNFSMTVDGHKKFSDEDFAKGIKIMSADDIRWSFVNIKTTALLPASLTKQKACDAGFDDALFVRNGVVTEATFANFFFVDQDGVLVTKKLDNFVLAGITRARIIDLAKKNGLHVVERDFSLNEVLQNAKEAFLTSSTLLVRPVVQIDENLIGDGVVGEITKVVKDLYLGFVGG